MIFNHMRCWAIIGGMEAHYRVSRVRAALLTAVITFAVYVPSLKNGFINWDDPEYVYENLQIRHFDFGLFKWAFLNYHSGNWHPLTWISLASDYAVWGLNPFGYHLTNVLLHVANTFLVTLLVAGLARAAAIKGLDERTAIVAAVATGLLFGLHPVHVESVAWITERKDVLYSFFYLLSILSYTKYVTEITPPGHNPSFTSPYLMGRTGGVKRGWRSRGHYLISFGFFCLALLSKPMAITLPFVLLILDWYPFRRTERAGVFALITEKAPLFVVCLFSAFLTMRAQEAGNAVLSVNIVPASFRTMVGLKAPAAYLAKMLWPFGLTPFYPYPHSESVLSLRLVVPAVSTVVMTLTSIAVVRKNRIWLASAGYYLVSLLPVLGIIQVGSQEMAERYTYLPSLGPFLVAGLGFAFMERYLWEKKFSDTARIFLYGAAAICIIALSAGTLRQSRIWRDGGTFWTRVIDVNPSVERAYYSRGEYYYNAGQYEKAVDDFTETLRFWNLPEVYNIRALAYAKLGLFDKALADADRSVEMGPNNWGAYVIRGEVLNIAGRPARAIEDLNRSLMLNTGAHMAYRQRGVSYLMTGRLADAQEDFDLAIRLSHPSTPHDYFADRAFLYSKLGRYPEALSDYSSALGIKDLPDIRYNRGNVLARLGRFSDALDDYSKAIGTAGRPNPDYYRNRAFVLEKLGRADEAAEDRRKAASMK